MMIWYTKQVSKCCLYACRTNNRIHININQYILCIYIYININIYMYTYIQICLCMHVWSCMHVRKTVRRNSKMLLAWRDLPAGHGVAKGHADSQPSLSRCYGHLWSIHRFWETPRPQQTCHPWPRERPSGYVKIAIDNGHLQRVFTLNMVIFHSHVSWPEGIWISTTEKCRSWKKGIWISTKRLRTWIGRIWPFFRVLPLSDPVAIQHSFKWARSHQPNTHERTRSITRAA